MPPLPGPSGPDAAGSYQVYEEPQPTTWDYGLPPGPAPAQQPAGWGYYDEPRRLAPDRADGFWDSFGGPASDPAYGATVPPGSPPYPPQAAQPAPRPPSSHRLVEARPATRRRRGLQGTIVAAVSLLMLACGGGAYAVVTSLTSHSANRSGTDAAGPATSAAARSAPLTPSASPASASASPAAASAPSGTAPPASTGATTTAPAGGQAPGTGTVAVSSGAQADPAEPAVAAWLSRYFTAINSHDYQAYVRLLDSQEAADESQSDFTSGYSTTTDSAETLTAISDLSGGGEAATVSFTSHQSAGQSVNGSSCDHWTITVYLEPRGSSYVTVPPPAGYHSSYESC